MGREREFIASRVSKLSLFDCAIALCVPSLHIFYSFPMLTSPISLNSLFPTSFYIVYFSVISNLSFLLMSLSSILFVRLLNTFD